MHRIKVKINSKNCFSYPCVLYPLKMKSKSFEFLSLAGSFIYLILYRISIYLVNFILFIYIIYICTYTGTEIVNLFKLMLIYFALILLNMIYFFSIDDIFKKMFLPFEMKNDFKVSVSKLG